MGFFKHLTPMKSNDMLYLHIMFNCCVHIAKSLG